MTTTQPSTTQPSTAQPSTDTTTVQPAGPSRGPAPGRDRAPRADAARNRAAIVAATREAVAALGEGIVLEDVARAAGVGIGTLYRHFPTRQDLLEAAFLGEAVELTERAEALRDDPDAFSALVGWLGLQLEFGTHGRRMGAAVMAAKHVEGSALQAACARMRDAGTELLHRAQASGGARPGVELTDVLRLVYGIVLADVDASDAERSGRMLDLVIAGIRA